MDNTLTPISLDDRLMELETNLIRWALDASHGNKSKAAALLQVKRSTLGDRIRRCGLDRPHTASSEPKAQSAGAAPKAEPMEAKAEAMETKAEPMDMAAR